MRLLHHGVISLHVPIYHFKQPSTSDWTAAESCEFVLVLGGWPCQWSRAQQPSFARFSRPLAAAVIGAQDQSQLVGAALACSMIGGQHSGLQHHRSSLVASSQPANLTARPVVAHGCGHRSSRKVKCRCAEAIPGPWDRLDASDTVCRRSKSCKTASFKAIARQELA